MVILDTCNHHINTALWYFSDMFNFLCIFLNVQIPIHKIQRVILPPFTNMLQSPPVQPVHLISQQDVRLNQ